MWSYWNSNKNTETFEALRDGRGDALSNDNTFLFAWAKQNPGYTVGVKNFGDQDVIAPAVRKDAPELLNWLNNEIQTLSKDGRLKQAYEKNLIARLWWYRKRKAISWLNINNSPTFTSPVISPQGKWKPLYFWPLFGRCGVNLAFNGILSWIRSRLICNAASVAS